MPPRAGRADYERSPGLVLHWSGSELVCINCESGRRYAVTPDVVALLNEAGSRPGDRRLAAVQRRLLAEGLLRRRGGEPWPWSTWMPAAALFHFGTRAGQYETNPRRSEQRLRAKARRTPPPAAVKRVPGQAVALPRPRDLGSLSASLKERRTWRNFSNRPVALDDLSTLLQLTFGVQHQARIKGQGDVVLKTSPSAGARHPLEAYVLARNVAGLRAGVYHYNAAGHALVSLHKRVSSRSLGALLADQRYFDRAGAVVVMAAVFERSMWKYPSARAYRAILIDAGHLGQTFCVLATALGLAPFSTMAFREAALDRVIGVDGVRESAMYVVGVGTRGKGAGARPGRIRIR